MERARKTSIIGTALRMEVRDLLHAFELAAPHATGRTYKAKLANQQEVALGILDWAIMESDRGKQLLDKHTVHVEADGTVIIGPIG